MKNLFLLVFAAGLFMMACNKTEKVEEVATTENPFFSEWNTPFGTPDFTKISDEYYRPAFIKGIEEKRADIKAIVENTEEPTFENTIVALEKSGTLLNRVSNVFFNLQGANTNDTIIAVTKDMLPELTTLSGEINMNEALFQRIKKLYDNIESLGLNKEQAKVLEDYYKSFTRNGALLDAAQKEELKKIDVEISTLANQFGNNVLAETNKFKMVIDNKEDLAGLPQSVIDAAAAEAKSDGQEGKWLFSIQKPSLLPFLTYSAKRELREKMFNAYTHMGDNNDELDNKENAVKIANLRVKRAHLLGFKSHADYILEENMAKAPAKFYELADKIWKPAVANAKKEVAEMQKIIDTEGGNFKLAAWDWWYYAEKVKKAKYDLDEEMLKPYFKLENVREGAFTLANKLWGITFEKRNDISVYHPEVEVFEVKEADGSHIGILYTDYFPRASKRGGAWMNAYRSRTNMGELKTPIICNVCNFTKPAGDKPSLLTFEEVTTLFHEFGHALHGLLTKGNYPSVTGTSVSRDFVELPSQIMENWCGEPEMLKLYAKHYETDEVIPDELIKKIQDAGKFNMGFVTTEYMAAALLDMDWHTWTEPKAVECNTFEKEALDKLGLIDEIVVRYRSTYFRHIFADPVGYSAGYYSYIWSGVLDSDAFEAFKETNLFDHATATSYRKNILEKGGSEDAMDMYKAFRGREPIVEPLLKKRGLL